METEKTRVGGGRFLVKISWLKRKCETVRCRDATSSQSSGRSFRASFGWLQDGWPTGRSWSPDRVKNFLFPAVSRPARGPTHPSIQWALGPLSPGVLRPGLETDYSPATSANIRKT
jgi:hypothetical protein